jgi:flagellar FliJ protein
MSGIHSLLVAVELATRKRDEARKTLQDLQSAQNAARDQLQQLEGYARETEDRWGMRADASVQPEVMYHHYQFMGRLGHAAQMQTQVVGDQGVRVERARRYLLETELRLASLQKVTDRRRWEMEQQQLRRDQKQTDERAALQYRGGNQGSDAQEDQ